MTAPRSAPPSNSGPGTPAPGTSGMPPEMPTPPKIGRPDGLARSVKDAPEQVRDGVKVWYAVAALQLFTGIIQLIATLTDRRALTREVTVQAADMELPEGISIENLVTGYAIGQFLLTLLSVVVSVWLISRVGRGGYKSRLFLSLGSVYLALMALMQTFAGAPETGDAALIVLIGAGTIISGVLAPVGWWFLTRPETNDWFGMPGEREMAEFSAALDRRTADLKRMKDAEKAEKAENAEKAGRNREKLRPKQGKQNRGSGD
ncbi:hypothetical protein [Corynebacterium terpenotabidum]|uniref:Uncharacterized protein n=1 Tax=Corynebacterium terpenotabidum Y-11 TaxID=1200352 RepID=S4XIT1_9CORY|nr:hypothetical protein [Corynebacterium terpenotabidum]AGP31660.1 hypothetical protein A606_10105 [Corynebacterium terpenotabidum Y-11]